jgi:hypothetical protein
LLDLEIMANPHPILGKGTSRRRLFHDLLDGSGKQRAIKLRAAFENNFEKTAAFGHPAEIPGSCADPEKGGMSEDYYIGRGASQYDFTSEYP